MLKGAELQGGGQEEEVEEERKMRCICTKVLKEEVEVWWGADKETKSKRARSVNENVRAMRGNKIMGRSNRRTGHRKRKTRRGMSYYPESDFPFFNKCVFFLIIHKDQKLASYQKNLRGENKKVQSWPGFTILQPCCLSQVLEEKHNRCLCSGSL